MSEHMSQPRGYSIELVTTSYAVVRGMYGDEGDKDPLQAFERTEVVPVNTFIGNNGVVLWDGDPTIVEQFGVPFTKRDVAGLVIGPTKYGQFINMQPFNRGHDA